MGSTWQHDVLPAGPRGLSTLLPLVSFGGVPSGSHHQRHTPRRTNLDPRWFVLARNLQVDDARQDGRSPAPRGGFFSTQCFSMFSDKNHGCLWSSTDCVSFVWMRSVEAVASHPEPLRWTRFVTDPKVEPQNCKMKMQTILGASYFETTASSSHFPISSQQSHRISTSNQNDTKLNPLSSSWKSATMHYPPQRAAAAIPSAAIDIFRAEEITGEISDRIVGWSFVEGFSVAPCPVTARYGAIPSYTGWLALTFKVKLPCFKWPKRRHGDLADFTVSSFQNEEMWLDHN